MKKTILVVDDVNTNVFCAFLKDHNCIQANSVTEAIDAINEEPHIDVAIIDYGLPDGSGLDVLSYLQKLSPATVTIMVTAYILPQLEGQAYEAGADYFLYKPVEREKFYQIIND